MKKIFCILLVFFAITKVQAQEKGFYLTIDGGLGWTNFIYDLNDGKHKGRLGYGGSVGAQYFFNRHWGISIAGEYFVYNTQSQYSDKSFQFSGQVDDEGDIYNLKLRLKNWEENQTTSFVEIPIMLMYQHKFGKAQKHGLYWGIGVKAQIPVNSTYEREDGSIKVSAYYPEWELPLGEEGLSVELPQHGYGTNGKRLWSGDNKLKTGFAAVGEFGALFGLSRRIDLTLGVSADYGFMDIKNKNEEFIGPVNGTTQQAGSYVAENVFYNGVLNSTEIEKINPLSVRGKIGLRIKIGKLKKQEKVEEELVIVEELYLAEEDTARKAADSAREKLNTSIDRLDSLLAKASGLQNVKVEKVDSLGAVKIEFNANILFDINKSILKKEPKEELIKLVAILQDDPGITIDIFGHTDNTGSLELNQRLSYDRAQSVATFLTSMGVDRSQIRRIIGKNYSMPIADNSTAEGRALNRRVEILMYTNRK